MKSWQSIMKECVQTDDIVLDANPDKHTLNCVVSSYTSDITIDDDILAKILKSAYNANYALIRDSSGTFELVYTVNHDKLKIRLINVNENILQANGYISNKLIDNLAGTFKVYLESHEIDKTVDGGSSIFTKERESYDSFFRYLATFFETYLAEY